MVGSQQWEIDYDSPTGGDNFTGDYVSGNFVTITAVPEPSTLVLVGIGGVLAAFIAPRRHKQRRFIATARQRRDALKCALGCPSLRRVSWSHE